jgi:glucose-1-phosphate adenylyltransferase
MPRWVGDDNRPNNLEPSNINTGITIVGKRAHVQVRATIGRNCRINANVTPDAFEQLEMVHPQVA